MLKHVNESEFEKEVIKNNNIVLVDFFATWCPPCKMLAPVLDEIANSRAPFDIVKVNIDDEMSLASTYQIEVVPTLLVFKNGKAIDKAVGYMEKNKIIDMMNKYVD